MRYRQIGNTGIRASVMGFGGMRFFQRDEATAHATVARCIERGITFFETGAYGDGKSEEVLGEALRRYAERDKIVLANKAGLGHRPDAADVRRSLEASLRRQQVEYFDVFSFWGANTPELFEHVMTGGPLDAVLKAKEEGLVRAIGLTTHARPEWILDFNEAHHWDCVTLKEHMLYSRQNKVIETLHAKGTGVVAMSPLAGGVIAAPGSEIEEALRKEGTTATHLALRYLASNPGVTSIISGMTSPEEVDQNVKAAETCEPLTETERRLIGFIRERTTGLGERFCTSCGYCLPCPQGVNIPGVFRLWNIQRGYGNRKYSRLEYGKMIKQVHWADFPGHAADRCVQCGQCLERCPEGLPIVEDLKRAHVALTSEPDE